MCLFIVLEYKQIFNKFKTLNFMENWPKIALFSPKMSQKAPRAPLGPPRTMKIVFLSCQDMKTICQKKEFLSYFPQKKKGVTISGENRTKFKNPPYSQKINIQRAQGVPRSCFFLLALSCHLQKTRTLYYDLQLFAFFRACSPTIAESSKCFYYRHLLIKPTL